MTKPGDVFDRDHEWAALEEFTSSPRSGASLGIVYGRRRQGKTYLLESLAEARGGVYVAALRQSGAQNLARLAEAYRTASGGRGQVVFSRWEQAFDALLSLGDGLGEPLLVSIDEFPYLLDGAPELPSVLQVLLSPRSAASRRYRTRLILCGSAQTTMRDLLGGSAPLRGRSSLELIVQPFSYRDAARFWGTAHDLELSLMLHALVGGTPAYREMCSAGPPSSPAGLDEWVVATLLNHASAMFREGNVLLAEEPRIGDSAGYFAVLAAISRGATRRGQIAAAIGRAEGALSHPLAVLTETQLIAPRPDVLRQKRTTYHVAEPILRLHQLVIAPNEARLVRHASEVWNKVADTVSSHIYGPHFEDLARQWCAEHASPDTLGGRPRTVGAAVVACPEHGRSHEIDTVILQASSTGAGSPILALGEAKWRSSASGLADLERLQHLRLLLGAPQATLLLFSRAGFSDGLIAVERARSDVELVDLQRLYGGE